MDNYKYQFVEDPGITTIKESAGVLKRIVITETAGGQIFVMDGIKDEDSTEIAEFKASVVEGTYDFDCIFAKGLYLQINEGTKLTVIYR